MYESFFGLKEKPFSLTPDPRFFYLSESHREALAAVIYGVREKAGLITLTGPVGVGKTMILASFLDPIKAHAEAALFSGAISKDRKEFLKDLCRALGISSEQGAVFELSQAIKNFALKKTGEGRSVVILVDEAQDLGLEELDHFHHLSNLEAPDAKLLQIVLAGTQKLDEKLKDKRMEALWQRAAIRCVIKPMEPQETIEYILHRLRVAGSSSSELLTEGALWRIVNYARGVPRLINLLGNQAMIAAYSSGRAPIGEDAVLESLKELDEESLSESAAEELVARDEIRGLVEVAFRRLEERADPLQGEEVDIREVCGILRDNVVPADQEELAWGSSRWAEAVSWLRPWRWRVAFSLILVLSLSTVGVLVTTGVLKRGEMEVERVVVASPEGPVVSREGDSTEATALGDSTEATALADSTEMAALGEDTATGGPEHAVKEEEDEVRTEEKEVAVQGRDLAGIALERYGRLDVEMLKLLQEKNPQIRDWNSLDQAAQLVLPDMPQGTKGGADFFTIQVGAFRAEKGANKIASDLAKREAQNLFLVKGNGNKITFVCVGVYESGRQSLGSIRKMKQWGYKDAFPTRIQAKRLEEILHPSYE
jgi:general secretion pathway protein A